MLSRLASDLNQHNIRLITLTDEKPSPSLEAFIRSERLSFPIHQDVTGTIRTSMGEHGTPTYAVVDQSGHLRYIAHHPSLLFQQAIAIATVGTVLDPPN